MTFKTGSSTSLPIYNLPALSGCEFGAKNIHPNVPYRFESWPNRKQHLKMQSYFKQSIDNHSIFSSSSAGGQLLLRLISQRKQPALKTKKSSRIYILRQMSLQRLIKFQESMNSRRRRRTRASPIRRAPWSKKLLLRERPNHTYCKCVACFFRSTIDSISPSVDIWHWLCRAGPPVLGGFGTS